MVAHKQRASTVYPNAKTRQTDIRGKSTAREGTDGNEPVIRKWRKGNPYTVADVSSIVGCSLCGTNEFGYSPKAISKQCVEGTGWFLLLLIGKCERKETT